MKRNPPAFGFVGASCLEKPLSGGFQSGNKLPFATVSGLSTGISEGESPAAEDPKAEDIAPGKGEPGTPTSPAPPPPPPPPVFLLRLDRAVDQHKFEGLRRITVSVDTNDITLEGSLFLRTENCQTLFLTIRTPTPRSKKAAIAPSEVYLGQQPATP